MCQMCFPANIEAEASNDVNKIIISMKCNYHIKKRINVFGLKIL